MKTGRGTLSETVRSGVRYRSGGVRRRAAAAFDAAVVLTGLVALALGLAGALAPRFSAAIPSAAMSSDGGHAFVFSPSFAPSWPYVVPSHPDFVLAARDVRVTEDGRLIGSLDPAHADIRERGGGLHNLWQGSLWFSPTDGTDPRVNGRAYGLSVRGRLGAGPALVLHWALGLFAFLAAFRAASLLATRAAPPAARAVAEALTPAWILLGRVPLSFRTAFCLVCTVLLGSFAWQALARPMPLLFEIDSFTYVQPGILWDAGRDVAGQSSRDVGYPAVAALALAMGSLSRLPSIKLVLVLAGLGCVLQVLYSVMDLMGRRLAVAAHVPVALTAACACGLAAVYLALMFSHDLFVIDIYSAMGEAPHVLPTAAAFALFVGSWTARRPVRRLCFAVSGVAAAYLSIMVKPHTSVVLALCAASLAVVALRHLRGFRSLAVLSTCLVSIVVVGTVHFADAWVTPPGADFGPKTIFCNRLDVVAPAFDASTPDRARVAALMHDVLRAPNNWKLMGFDGDRCVYNTAMTDAITAVAKAEGMSTAAWQTREFLKAVVAEPGAYARDVTKQVAFYLQHPVVDIDHQDRSVMPDDVWERFAPFMDRIRMSHDQFLGDVGNWVPTAYPRLSRLSKRVLDVVGATFTPFTLGGTILALVVLLARRGRGADLRLEAAVLASGTFTMAFVMTTALSHSFDIGRYLTDILPFSLIWWITGLVYLAHALAVCGALAVRQEDHESVADDACLEESRTLG